MLCVFASGWLWAQVDIYSAEKEVLFPWAWVRFVDNCYLKGQPESSTKSHLHRLRLAAEIAVIAVLLPWLLSLCDPEERWFQIHVNCFLFPWTQLVHPPRHLHLDLDSKLSRILTHTHARTHVHIHTHLAYLTKTARLSKCKHWCFFSLSFHEAVLQFMKYKSEASGN